MALGEVIREALREAIREVIREALRQVIRGVIREAIRSFPGSLLTSASSSTVLGGARVIVEAVPA
jgi:hypothetical protein